MNQYINQVLNLCRNTKKENSEDENDDGNEKNYTQKQDDEQINYSNNNEGNFENSTKMNGQQVKNVKITLLSKTENNIQQKQTCNQNLSENNDFKNEQQSQYTQRQMSFQYLNSQPLTNVMVEGCSNTINQNLLNNGNQINNQQSQIRFVQGSQYQNINNTQRAPQIINYIDPIQNNYTLSYQQQLINSQQPIQSYSQIRKEQIKYQFNNNQWNGNQQIDRNMQMNENQNFIDFQRNNYIDNIQPQSLIEDHQQLNQNINTSQFKQRSQLKNINQSFESFESSQTLTIYQSCNYDELSKTQTQQVRCVYCEKEVNIKYFQLKCQHFYCSDCLKEFLKNQSKQINCYAYKCLCQSKDRVVEMLKEKLILNQINALKLNIQNKYQSKNCRNKYCQFFVIIQENLDSSNFYCPNCLDKQSDYQLNQ